MAEIYKELIPFEAATGVLNKTVKDYYGGADALKKFYGYKPDIAEIERVIANRKKYPFHRAEVVNVLLRQYEYLNKAKYYDVTAKQVQLLKEENTFTITTAHQPNLLLGPLYYIYKIASVIHFSQILKEKYPAYNFIPVFWIGSEDHDTEELAHINLFGKKLEWQTTHEGAFGQKPLDKMDAFKTELQSVLGASLQTTQVMQLLEENYFNEKNISSAAKKLLHHLFGAHGLLIIDGNDVELKKIFAPVIKDELLNHSAFNLVNNTIKELEQAGYTPQAHPREINLFYLDEQTRQRVVFENNSYKISGTTLSFTKEEIIALVESHPERFSPNVILRPVYQETVLPNIAFIGGAAELSYCLQLKTLFAHHKTHYPILLLRDIVLLMEENTISRINKLGLELKDMFLDKEELIKKYLSKNTIDGFDLSAAKAQLKNIYDQVEANAKKTDPTLGGAVQAEMSKVVKGIEGIEDKIRRAEKRKNETVIQQIDKLKEKVFPSGTFQERYTNFLEYYLIYGEDFIPAILSNINLLEPGVKVLVRKN